MEFGIVIIGTYSACIILQTLCVLYSFSIKFGFWLDCSCCCEIYANNGGGASSFCNNTCTTKPTIVLHISHTGYHIFIPKVLCTFTIWTGIHIIYAVCIVIITVQENSVLLYYLVEHHNKIDLSILNSVALFASMKRSKDTPRARGVHGCLVCLWRPLRLGWRERRSVCPSLWETSCLSVFITNAFLCSLWFYYERRMHMV